MPYDLTPFQTIPLDAELLTLLIDEHESTDIPRYSRLWSYYRNALAEPDALGGSRGAPAQWVGLPARLKAPPKPGNDDIGHGDVDPAPIEREIVIENDISWRVHTLIDFMFPSSPRLLSKASGTTRRAKIEQILESVFVANGGDGLWQNAALLGSVYGHVDFMVNTHALPADGNGSGPDRLADAVNRAAQIVIEIVEAPRAIPLLNRSDYRVLDAFVLRYRQATHAVDAGSALSRLSRAVVRRSSTGRRRAMVVTEIHSAASVQRYENEELVDESINRLGRLPVVHVQNLAQPLQFAGVSDVEPLIPLQDELNTRLSDRANRVTLQSFRMWLGKGIDGFDQRPVGPGQMWVTDNLDASIEGFGGDASSPSETAHIEELREALDKASGVTPAAAGHIKARVGNLTSENALRISLMGTIAKIKRKRITYGAGIAELAELVLHALHVHGIYETDPAERGVDVVWADPLPTDQSRRITDALNTAKLGVPLPVLRSELGYVDDEG